MDKQKLTEIPERLFVESAGKEHERLKAVLLSWAEGKGFRHKFGRLASGVPDALLGTDEKPSYLFVGDAKDSAHETVGDFATWERIYGYMQDFGMLIEEGRIRGGVFAIVTNTQEAAEQWARFLTAMANRQRLAAGGPPDFKVDEIGELAFVAYW